MKTYYGITQVLFLVMLLFSASLINAQGKKKEQNNVSKLWETERVFKTPESVIYDSENKILYVSNFNVKGGFVNRADTTADEFISKVNLKGEIIELNWAKGLLNPCGIAIYEDKLYAVERRRLAEIDLKTGSILNRYPIPGSLFPNDIAFDSEGNGYITDNNGNAEVAVYKFSKGEITPWILSEQVLNPNGICIIDDKIYVGDKRDRSLKSINIKDKKMEVIAQLPPVENMEIFDGLRPAGKGKFIATLWSGAGYLISESGDYKEVFNTSDYITDEQQKINNADIEFIRNKNLIIVPTFTDNRLMAFLFKIN